MASSGNGRFIVDDGIRLWLIDWEYAGFGSALFDLANLASNNELDEEQERALLTLYYGQLPSPSLRRSYDVMRSVSLLRETLWGMVSEIHSKLDVDYHAYATNYRDRFEQSLARLDLQR